LQGCQHVSGGVKEKSSPSGKAAATSSMVSRGVDQDTEKEAAARKARRFKQGGELWTVWDKQQPDPKGKGPSADVNMVFMLPMEFLAPSSDDELESSDQIAQLALDPMTAIFKKPADDERQHLKALFVKGRVDGQPMTKI